jgi:periplasmic protein TonB
MADMNNAIWRATTLANDESTIRNAALSVRQRKLLALLNTPMSVDAMATMSGIAHPEVEQNLQRFQKLGLASSGADAALGAAPSAMRATTFSTAPASTGSDKSTPLIVGGVALTAVAAAIWWFTQSSSPTATPRAPAQSGNAPNPSPTLASPGDSATTNIYVAGTAVTSEAEKQAILKEARDAAAKEAAKEAAKAAKANPATAQPAVAAAPTATPAAAPQPSATPPTTAAAPPVASPAPAPAAAREGALVSRVEPGFPRGADVDRGTVRARLTVNATGAVTNVEIIEANPPRVFDRNVRSALSQWRYEGTGETQTKLVEVQFTR